MEKAITKPDAGDIGVDVRTFDSFVTRGDWSGLGPRDRALAYAKICEQHGLNPFSQPFAFLRLNGKEVLYATRGATDQLAAIHKLNREIVDGPKVVDIAGTKVGYAVARVTHPNGRIETSTATLPLVDPVNLYMKLETKAKRRATLSILGLGLLDEQELETIPASAKGEATQVDPAQLRMVDATPPTETPAEEAAPAEQAEEEGPSSRAFSAYCDAIITAATLVAIHNLYQALLDGLYEEGADVEHFTQGDDGAAARAYRRMAELGHRLSKEECAIVLRDRPFAEVLDTMAYITPGPEALKLSARWWVDRRVDRLSLDAAYQKKPWLPLVRRYSGVTSAADVKRAGAALEAAIKLLSPPPANGDGASSGGAGASSHGGGTEASSKHTAPAALAEFRTHIGEIPLRGVDHGAGRVAGAFWKRSEDFREAGCHADALGYVLDALAARRIAEPHPYLTEIGVKNGYVQRPAKAA